MAGKVQAGRNVARLKAIHDATASMMAEAGVNCDGSPLKESAAPTADGDLVDAVEAVLRTSDSADAKRQALKNAIREALKAKHRDPMAAPDAYGPYVWVRDLFPSSASVVYEADETLYQASYTLAGEGEAQTVAVGDPVEVEIAYVPKGGALTEAADLDEPFTAICLEEKAVRADGTTTLKVINPGWGSSGYYSREVIERDGPKVFTAGTKMYADHPTAAEEAARPERSIKDLAAVLTGNARWQDAGPDGRGLYAEAKVYDTWRKPIDEMAADIGVSIRAAGRARMGEAEGRKGPIVEAIVAAKSIDFVTDAGRGGKIMPLSEAARQRGSNTRPALAAPHDDRKEVSMPLSEAEVKQLQENQTAMAAQIKTLEESNARMREAALVSEAATLAGQLLAGVALPQVTKERLVEGLKLKATVKDGALDRTAFRALVEATAKDEASYLAQATGAGHIRGMGASDINLGESRGEVKLEDALADVEAGFKRLGLSESGAKTAATGK